MQGQGLALWMRNLRTQPNPNTFSWFTFNKIINLMRLYVKATFIAHKLYNTLNKPFRVTLFFLGTNLATI
ncbi:hypothetical protein DDM57_16360 [Vibrio cholerae]|nr:hypothetical protein [Vibrio cholerae]